MNETWPAPELRKQRDGLGWLAISDPSDLIHIGVTAPTEAEATHLYEQKRHYWATLADQD
jgi:hypothetical protein